MLHAHLPRCPCGDVLRSDRDEHTWLRFPACDIRVHLVSRPVARNDAAGLVPDVLVVARGCARNDDIIRGDGRIVNAHGDVIVSLQVEVFQPICAGDKRQHFTVIPVPIRGEMRMAMPVHGRHHRNVRRGKILRDLLLIHRGPSGPSEPDLGRLRQFAVNLGLGERVEFTGMKAPGEVPALLRQADVLVLPNRATSVSANYTSPLKLFEYLAVTADRRFGFARAS